VWSAGSAAPQAYPNRLIKVVVASVAGGLADIVARAIGDKLSINLKQPVVIENHPGAGGNIGTEAVAKAAPDGYTLGHALSTVLTVNPSLYKKLPFDPDKDFRPISIVTTTGQMLVVHPRLRLNVREPLLGGNAMKLPRRNFLHLAAVAAALPAVSQIARAQTYPTRPVRLIVGFPPGGVGDISSRLMGQWLSDRLGQPFVIENRPGAASNIATEAVVKAPPDGYTLLHVSTTNAINATLYDKVNFRRDVAPVAGIIRVPLVMVVNPSVPAKTVPEFIAYAKANPGRISMASAGNGSTAHVAGELFKMMTSVDMVHVPYRGSAPAVTDLLGGQVQVMFDPLSSSIEHIKAGKLRALAVTTRTRWETLPDIPTLGDFVPSFEASAWQGVAAPKNMPAEIVEKLNKEINTALADPKMTARLADVGGTVLRGSYVDFAKLIAEDIEKWAKVIRAANVKPE
jgi:tripartite-type tricarboxylate transporter receptor subunit TctC